MWLKNVVQVINGKVWKLNGAFSFLLIWIGVSFQGYVPEALRFYSSLDILKFIHVIMSDLTIEDKVYPIGAISLGARYILKRLELFESSSGYIEYPVKLLWEGNNFEVISSKYTSGSIVCQSWRNLVNFAKWLNFFF